VFLVLCVTTVSAQYSHQSEVVSSGGGSSIAGTVYSNFGVLGQTFVASSVSGGNFNNSIGFLNAIGQLDEDNDGVMNDIDLCPNTPLNTNVDANGCFFLPSDNFNLEVIGETCSDKNNGQLVITANQSHDYTATINGTSYDFTTSNTIIDLPPDTYTICITVAGVTFEQCYTITIPEGATISGRSSVSSKKVSIAITSGTAPFDVLVNGKVILKTFSSTFEIPVIHGDVVEVKTGVSCEGIFSKTIDLFETVTVFPNPTHGIFEIALPMVLKEIKIELFTTAGQLVLANTYPVVNGKVQLNIESLPSAVYVAKVYLENPVSVQIIKN